LKKGLEIIINVVITAVFCEYLVFNILNKKNIQKNEHNILKNIRFLNPFIKKEVKLKNTGYIGLIPKVSFIGKLNVLNDSDILKYMKESISYSKGIKFFK